MIHTDELGIPDQPECWQDILWPLAGQPAMPTSASLYEELCWENPDIDVGEQLLKAFHYMIDRWDQPGEAKNVVIFLKKWMSLNQKNALQAARYFPKEAPLAGGDQ